MSHCFPIRDLFGFIVIGISTLSATAGCSVGESSEAGPASSKKGGPPRAPVRVMPIVREKVPPKIVIVGTVLPRRTSVVASGASGIVAEYFVDIGQYVEKGDALSQLRTVTTDIGIKEAGALLKERERALAELENGSREDEIKEARARHQVALELKKKVVARLARARNLYEAQSINDDELDEAVEAAQAATQVALALESRLRLVEAGPRVEQVEQARARRDAQAEQVKFLEAERNKRKTTAPFQGYVVESHTDLGQWLAKGDPIVTLAFLEQVYVACHVDQDDIRHVTLGKKVNIRVQTELRSEKWQGIVFSIVPRSEWQTGSRGFPILVRVDNKFHQVAGRRIPVLKEGMMAQTTFFGEPVEALLVPKDAVVRTPRGMSVWVVDVKQGNSRAGAARQVFVQIGISQEGLIQVTGDTLSEGVQVVTEGAERLHPFQPVQIID